MEALLARHRCRRCHLWSFCLYHNRDVDADGNCLFTAIANADARDLKHRAVRRFTEVYAAAGEYNKGAVNATVRHLYAPDLKVRWGVP